ncbi:PPE family protein [Mycobacterium haemophilum]|uniref:PPE family protein n=1 Tax=Mycobacterium haemophilum TaxID=29311 RepID=UPI000AADD418|nr:PPE family protein [Mycobacterium haemophilum]
MPNFDLISPEVNVKSIHGPGSKPMRTAAAAWASLYGELDGAAGRWLEQVVATENLFTGPAAEKFVAAAGQYHGWLIGHANTAWETYRGLDAAAEAYEKAVESMVPTSSIVANRATALTLKTTNLLGQFTTKIMELDDEYQKMWAQNAEAMNQYQFTIFDIMAQVEESRIIPAPQIIDDTSKSLSHVDYVLI